MEEFARMIYQNWANATDECEDGNGASIDWGDYDETVRKIYDFLNEHLANELECAINKRVWKVQENSFIAGFFYACKCLSNGKIELRGGVSE